MSKSSKPHPGEPKRVAAKGGRGSKKKGTEGGPAGLRNAARNAAGAGGQLKEAALDFADEIRRTVSPLDAATAVCGVLFVALSAANVGQRRALHARYRTGSFPTDRIARSSRRAVRRRGR